MQVLCSFGGQIVCFFCCRARSPLVEWFVSVSWVKVTVSVRSPISLLTFCLLIPLLRERSGEVKERNCGRVSLLPAPPVMAPVVCALSVGKSVFGIVMSSR